MQAPTQDELETAFADCVKRRGRAVADGLLQTFGGVSSVQEVPENRRLMTKAALGRRPREDRNGANDNRPANIHQALAAIRTKAFARKR